MHTRVGQPMLSSFIKVIIGNEGVRLRKVSESRRQRMRSNPLRSCATVDIPDGSIKRDYGQPMLTMFVD